MASGSTELPSLNAKSEKESSSKTPPSPCTLVFCGSSKWDMIGRKTLPKKVAQRGGSEAGSDLLAPTRLKFVDGPEKYVSAHSGSVAAHAVLVDSDGVAWGIGRNDNGQLGASDLLSKSTPIRMEVPEHEKVVFASCGRGHTLLLTAEGSVYACGNNMLGQLGIGGSEDIIKAECPVISKVNIKEKVVSVAAGSDFSVFIGESGTINTCGSGQHGQLGRGHTGERIGTHNSISYSVVTSPVRLRGFGSGKHETSIKDVACGANHAIVRDSERRIWSWGWGAYGRLGHETPDSQLEPKLVEKFTGRSIYRADLIACGETSSFAVQFGRNSMYMWGVSRKNSEAKMYPKPIDDLQGFEVRSLSCGRSSTVVAAEKSVISWGPSPTCGELGYGKKGPKSSTKPKLMDSMEGLRVMEVAAGMAFTFLLVTAENSEEKELLTALPEMTMPGNDAPKGLKRKSQGIQGNTKNKKKPRRR